MDDSTDEFHRKLKGARECQMDDKINFKCCLLVLTGIFLLLAVNHIYAEKDWRFQEIKRLPDPFCWVCGYCGSKQIGEGYPPYMCKQCGELYWRDYREERR